MTALLQVRREFLLRREAEKDLDEIILLACKRIRLLAPGHPSPSDKDEKVDRITDHQLRNAVNVAMSTSSVLAVTNFIRYQIGREKVWRTQDFGETVIADIEKGRIREVARDVAIRVARALGLTAPHEGGEDGDLFREAHVLLTRLYLGYVLRWFTYAERAGAWEKLRSVVEEAPGHV